MKVYEIISERKFGEGAVADLFKGGVKMFYSKPQLIDQLSKDLGLMGRFFKGNPATAADIERLYGKAAGDMVRADDTILGKAATKFQKQRAAAQAAEKEADRAAAAARSSRGAEDLTKPVVKVIGPKMKAAFLALNAYEFAKPLQEYLDKIAYFEEQVKKDPSLADGLEQAKRNAASSLVGAWASLIVAGSLGPKIFQGTLGIISEKLAEKALYWSPYVRQLIMYQMSKSDTAMMYASAMMGALVPGIAEKPIVQLMTIFEKPYEWLKSRGWVGSRNDIQPASNANGGTAPQPSDSNTSQSNVDATSQDAGNKPVTPPKKDDVDAAAKAQHDKDEKDPANWKPLPSRPNLSTNIKTGNITYTSKVPEITGQK